MESNIALHDDDDDDDDHDDDHDEDEESTIGEISK
jgi:hypothetical protein